MQNRYLPPNINNIKAFPYAFRMTFGNNFNNNYNDNRFVKSQILSLSSNTINNNQDLSLNPKNEELNNLNNKEMPSICIKDYKEDDYEIEMGDDINKEINNIIKTNDNIENQINELNEENRITQSISNLNKNNKNNKKKIKKIKKNNLQKYIQSNIEEEYMNYEVLQKEGTPSIYPYINEKGKKILYSFKRKSGLIMIIEAKIEIIWV